MPLQRVLIAVKTYPVLSTKYQELVCTAGFREDGSWIRIYPVPYRKLDFDKQYKKYQWVEINLVKNEKDPRPESFKVVDLDSMKLCESIPPKPRKLRDDWVLREVFTAKDEIIRQAHANQRSLATFRPKRILDMEYEETEREYDRTKLDQVEQFQAQLDLFGGQVQDAFEVVEKLPYTFFYRFEDETGKESRLMIEDWEIGALYRNCLKQHEGDENKAIEGVLKKYKDEFLQKRDIFLLLGTTLKFHNLRSLNPYVITGVYAPQKEAEPVQAGLF